MTWGSVRRSSCPYVFPSSSGVIVLIVSTFLCHIRRRKEMLPEEGEEAGAGAEAVVGIAGEVTAEHFFLVEEAEDDQGNNGEEARERPPGAERKRREEQHENSAEVHGMADEPIGSSGDDSLPLFDLDGARGETVLFHDPKRDEIAGEDEELGKNREPKRDARPAETIIQSGDQ